MKVDWVALGEVLELQRRTVNVLSESTYQEIGVRSFGRGLFIKPPVSGVELGDKRVFEIRAGDFIVSNVFGWEGAVAVAGPEHDGLIGSHRFMTWVPRDDVDVNYLRHYFGSDAGVASLAAASPGSAGRNRTLAIRNFEPILVPLPARLDQVRIATHLNKLSQLRPGHRLRDRIIDWLTARDVVDAPLVRVRSLLELQRRTIDVDVDETYREVGLRSFGRGLFIKEPVTGADLGGKRVFRLAEGDLVVSNVFGWEGAVGVAGPEHGGLIGSHRFMTWTPRTDVKVEYICAYFRSVAGISRLAAASPGSAGRNRTLSIANFEAIEVPLPASEVQDRLVACVKVADEINSVAMRADHLARAILPAARNEIFSAMR